MYPFRIIEQLILWVLVLISVSLYAQSDLSLEEIMRGPEFVGALPSQPTWSIDGQFLYFRWNPEHLPSEDWYRYSLSSGEVKKLSLEEQHEVPGAMIYNHDRTKAIYSKHGDLFYLDKTSGAQIQITNTLSRESDPQFSGNEKKVLFRKEDNLFTWTIASGETTQITDFKKGSSPKDPEGTDQEDWLKRDQLAYFQILKERSDEDAYRTDKFEQIAPKRPREIFTGKGDIWQIQASPDLSHAIYQLSFPPTDQKQTKVPDFVTEEGYVNNLPARAKVGSPQRSFQTWIYQIDQDTHLQIDPLQIPGIYQKPDYLQEYHRGDSVYVDTFSQPRQVSMLKPSFNPDGTRAVMVIRSHDHKDRWLMSLDVGTATLSLIDRQRDEAWIGGPGIGGWSLSRGNLGWISDDVLWFQSEESGYSHLYIYDFADQSKKALTSGAFEILDAQLSHDKQSFFIHASKEGPFELHFYRFSLKDERWERLTHLPGRHEVTLSPDEKNIAILYSYSNKPTELYIAEEQSWANPNQVTNSTTAAFKNYSWRDPEIIQFEASDGQMVPARIYQPEADQKNGAAVIFVHGAGYLHNVHKWWSSYYREFMFHNLLADHGYTVLDIDYRASAGYGRDWRTAIYRHMGGKDLSDQVDGAKYLIDNHDIDPEKLGIYGGSYGGFITLMALCTAPGVFKCGAALRSVTDWAHYNHGYTSRILNTPVEDSIAFFRSSPIYHAQHLEGELIMLHGMVDRNVQFQDVVRMTQRFIEAGKRNFELAVFPMEGHGFVEPSSWTDEYARIFELFERNLRD